MKISELKGDDVGKEIKITNYLDPVICTSFGIDFILERLSLNDIFELYQMIYLSYIK